MTRAERIQASLSIFAPSALTVEDESGKHAGHAGASPSGETHYAVTIVSEQFTGLSRVERQRRINAALAGEFQSGVHALSLKALSPGEVV